MNQTLLLAFVGKAESPKYPTHYNARHLNDPAKKSEMQSSGFLA
jgi:hypothetical protein